MTLAILAALASQPSSETRLVVDPSGNGAKPVSMNAEPLPSPGTYNAWQFLAIAAGANVPWSCEATPATHTTPKLGADRDGMKRAIAGYCGYNDALPFGEQERNARILAQAEIAPAMGRLPMAPRPSFTVAGLVAGMPDERGRALRNFQARIRLAKQAAAEFRLVSDLPTFHKAVTDHIVDEELTAALTVAANAGTFLALATRQAEEHETLLGKLESELAESGLL